MNRAFFKIIEQLEAKLKEPYYQHNGEDYFVGICEAIEIANQVADEHKNKYVSIGAYKQVMWERDIAIKQLHELGYGLGEKIRDGWIPCSKRLPKENGWYECWRMVSTVRDKKEYRPETLYWEDNLWLYHPNSFSMPTKSNIVAWKPIVPYKSESEER